jgi:hypothetical protein
MSVANKVRGGLERPSTVNFQYQNYLALPSVFARLHPLREGKTAHQLLLEQLDLLDGKMREIAADLHHQNSQQLLIHGRFLEDKFRDGQAWLAGG